MFDIGMTELLVIGIVALIVVGPKDLPGMFRTLGRFTAKIKGMAREFQRAMDDAADESGVRNVARDLRDATSPKKMGLDRLNEAADKFEKWEPGKSAKSKAGSAGAEADKAMGPETRKLSEERAASSARILEATGRAATERKAREAQAAAPVKTAGTGADTPLSSSANDKDQA